MLQINDEDRTWELSGNVAVVGSGATHTSSQQPRKLVPSTRRWGKEDDLQDLTRPCLNIFSDMSVAINFLT